MSQTETPMFTVAIPVHNRQDLIRHALESAFAQRFTDFEVLVVDDGSTDQTSSVLAEYGDRIRALRQDNAGIGAARNTCIANAHGRYLAWLDSDDLWFPWTLATFAKVIEAHDEPALILGAPRPFANVDDLKAAQETALDVCRYTDPFATAPDKISRGTSAAVARTDILRDSPGFEPQHMNYEDVDFFMKIGTAPGTIKIHQPYTVAYRQHVGSTSTAHPDKTLKGIDQLIVSEKAGRYPGGPGRRWERRQIICREVRGSIDLAVRHGRWLAAVELYARCLHWQLRLGRFRFLLGMPVYALLRTLLPGRARRVRRSVKNATAMAGPEL